MLDNKSKWKSVKVVALLSAVIILSLIGYDKYLGNSNTTTTDPIASSEEIDDQGGTYKIPEEVNQLMIDAEEIESSDTDSSQTFNELNDTETTEIKYSGWIPSWGYSDGMDSLYRNPELFDVIMPVWYGTVASGALVDRRPANTSELLSYAGRYEVAVIPSIAMFDADLMQEILSGQSLDDHVNAIVNEVMTNNYDGIDLDYESTYVEDAAAFELFLQKLYTNLDARNKILSVTVLAQWGDDVVYTGLKQTRQVQDWGMINKYSHQVRIMAYDFTSSGSSVAGPIGPINWQRQVLDYAVEKFDANKVWLGVHLYSYAWSEDGYYSSYTYDDMPEILDGATYQAFNAILKEGYAEYPCGGNTCKIYYQTPAGVAARSTLALNSRFYCQFDIFT